MDFLWGCGLCKSRVWWKNVSDRLHGAATSPMERDSWEELYPSSLLRTPSLPPAHAFPPDSPAVAEGSSSITDDIWLIYHLTSISLSADVAGAAVL